jgi:hypothetical protein
MRTAARIVRYRQRRETPARAAHPRHPPPQHQSADRPGRRKHHERASFSGKTSRRADLTGNGPTCVSRDMRKGTSSLKSSRCRCRVQLKSSFGVPCLLGFEGLTWTAWAGVVQFISSLSVVRELLATSLCDDPAAELHEDASVRLREHPAHLGCSILRRSSPGVRRERLPGSRWRPRGGRRGQSQRATGFSRDTALGSAAGRRIGSG